MDNRDTDILTLVSLVSGFRKAGNTRVILRDFSTGIKRGELVAVIGKNGSGKSTLLRTITGLQLPVSGRIFHDGTLIENMVRLELAKKVSYVSTEPVKAANMTVYDLVSLGRFPYTNWAGRINEDNHVAIMDAINKTGMTAMASRFISELSDGERQKAMIARVISQDTSLLIMDEPTAFLDIGSKFEILRLLHDLSRQSNRSIIFSTHDMHLAMSQADKIWLLKNSTVIEGAPEDLMLQGEFDHLFDSSSVTYDAEQGTFVFTPATKGDIYLEGEGVMRNWTERALMRTGYSVAAEKTATYIIVPSGNSKFWQMVTRSGKTEYNSIYDLVRALTYLT